MWAKWRFKAKSWYLYKMTESRLSQSLSSASWKHDTFTDRGWHQMPFKKLRMNFVIMFSRLKMDYRSRKCMWSRKLVAVSYSLSSIKTKGKVKLSLCFNWTPRHEGVLGEWRYSSMHSFILTLEGVSCQLHAPIPLPPGKEPPVPIG
jgi:hypothetical protein